MNNTPTRRTRKTNISFPASEMASSSTSPSRSNTNTTTNNNKQPSTAQAASRPFLPTSHELAFLAIYPATLVFGSAYAHLSPSTRPPYTQSVYSPAHQSFQPPEHAPSYFATKRNVFNVYFVKVGWFWITLALVAFVALGSRSSRALGARLRQRRAGKSGDGAAQAKAREEGEARLRRRWQAGLRWSLATLFWYATTQWFFGAPLIDRGFVLSGGACDGAEREAVLADSPSVKALVTHAACSVAGGKWRGGYDMSGHVFLLVVGSGMLWLEMLPVLLPAWREFGAGRVVRMADGRVVRVGSAAATLAASHTAVPSTDPVEAVQRVVSAEMQSRQRSAQIKSTATYLALGVALLSLWMLLMTSAFFHTWSEKASACVWAVFVLWTVYILPRGVPLVRDVLGMPGV